MFLKFQYGFPWLFFPCSFGDSWLHLFLALFAVFPWCFGLEARIPCCFVVVSLLFMQKWPPNPQFWLKILGVWGPNTKENKKTKEWKIRVGDRFLSGAGTGKNCSLSLSLRVPNAGTVLAKNRAPMGPELVSSIGAGVLGKAPEGFPDSNSVAAIRAALN